MDVLKIREMSSDFYPKSKDVLHEMMDKFKRNIKETKSANVKAVIVPHAAYNLSGQIAAGAFEAIPKETKTLIVVGPSHHILFSGAAISGDDAFDTPAGPCVINHTKEEKLGYPNYPYAHEHEHSVEVQMPLIKSFLPSAEVVPILTGDVDSLELAADMQKVVDDTTVIVVSSDLSYYNDYEDAHSKDMQTIQRIKELDFISEEQACGYRIINALLILARKKGWKAEPLQYTNSGSSATKDHVVGYFSCVFYEKTEDEDTVSDNEKDENSKDSNEIYALNGEKTEDKQEKSKKRDASIQTKDERTSEKDNTDTVNDSEDNNETDNQSEEDVSDDEEKEETDVNDSEDDDETEDQSKEDSSNDEEKEESDDFDESDEKDSEKEEESGDEKESTSSDDVSLDDIAALIK